MNKSLQILQIVLSLLVVALVLLQSKGGGLASGIGSSISFYRSRRGIEKAIFIFTIVIAFSLVINSLLLVLLA